jgi:hypothetical protein
LRPYTANAEIQGELAAMLTALSFELNVCG